MHISLMNVQKQFENHAVEYENAILKVARSGQYIGGDEVTLFEREFSNYMGTQHAISCGNGTDALVIALRALGIGIGDEVITTAFTFFATGESIAQVGATPVFVDVDKNTYCINPTLIEEKITAKTKAILPVHIYGNCADMDKIREIAQKYNLKIITDCAQSAGTKYYDSRKNALGDIACFSFFPTKTLGGLGDGGMILTDDENIAHICKAFRSHGSGIGGSIYANQMHPTHKDFEQLPSTNYDKYHNYFVGYNSRLDAIQAAVLRKKLTHLDEFLEARRTIAAYYDEHLSSAVYHLPQTDKHIYHSYYVYVLQHDKAQFIMQELKNNGIESRTYYPIPLHLQVAFSHLEYNKGDLPVTEHLCETTFAIPLYPEMTQEEVIYVVNILNKIALKL